MENNIVYEYNNYGYKSDKFKEEHGNIHDKAEILKHPLPKLLSKNKLEEIINIFKKEIDLIKTEKINFDKKKEENIKEKYNFINPLKSHLIRIKKYNNNSGLNEKIQNISENLLFKKKIQKKINKFHLNKELESNFSQISNSNSSFSKEKKIVNKIY